MAGHRHGRHPRHRPLRQDRSLPHLEGYGFHPLAAWCANTRECLRMLLRPGNAGSNTFTDHRKCWPRPSGRPRPGSAAKSWSASTGPEPGTTSSGTCWPCHPRGRKLWSPAAGPSWPPTRTPSGSPGGRLGSRAHAGRRHRRRQRRHRDHRPHDQGREQARPAPLERPPGEAVPAATCGTHALREGDWLEVLHHLYERPGLRHPGRPGEPPPAVHRRRGSRARRRRDGASAPPRPWAGAWLGRHCAVGPGPGGLSGWP